MSTTTTDGHVVLTLRGDLDLAATPRFDAALAAARPLVGPLTIDLAAIGFVDSSGLRSLIAARQVALEDTGTGAALAGVAPDLRRLLDISGLADAFSMLAPGEGRPEG